MAGRCRAKRQVLMSITLQGAVWELVDHRVMWVTCAGLEDGPWELLPVTEHGVFKQWFNMPPFFFCFPFFSSSPLSSLSLPLSSPPHFLSEFRLWCHFGSPFPGHLELDVLLLAEINTHTHICVSTYLFVDNSNWPNLSSHSGQWDIYRTIALHIPWFPW